MHGSPPPSGGHPCGRPRLEGQHGRHPAPKPGAVQPGVSDRPCGRGGVHSLHGSGDKRVAAAVSMPAMTAHHRGGAARGAPPCRGDKGKKKRVAPLMGTPASLCNTHPRGGGRGASAAAARRAMPPTPSHPLASKETWRQVSCASPLPRRARQPAAALTLRRRG